MNSRNINDLESISWRTVIITGVLAVLVFTRGYLAKHYSLIERPAKLEKTQKQRPSWYNPESFTSSNNYRQR